MDEKKEYTLIVDAKPGKCFSIDGRACFFLKQYGNCSKPKDAINCCIPKSIVFIDATPKEKLGCSCEKFDKHMESINSIISFRILLEEDWELFKFCPWCGEELKNLSDGE